MDIAGGFVQVPNKFIEAMSRVKLNGTQHNIMNFIVRQMWGYRLENKAMSITYIANGIGLAKSHVQREIDKLIELNLIKVVQQYEGNESRKFKINEDYDSWIGVRESKIPVPQSEYGKYTNQSIQGAPQSEYQLNKDLNKNLNKTSYSEDFEEFFKVYPKSENKSLTFHEWKKLIKEHDPQEIISAAKRYKRSITPDTEERYITKSYNFLSKGRYWEYLQGEEPKQRSGDKEFNPDDWI